MRKTVTLLLGCVVLATAMLVCSCEDEGGEAGPNKQDNIDNNNPIPVNLSFGVIGPETKVTEDSFEAGDQIGLYMVYGPLQNSGNHVDNKKYSLISGAWKTEGEIFWNDSSTPADFYAYCPYGSPAYVSEYEFIVNANQSNLASFKAADFLWGRTLGVAPSQDLIGISMSHVLSTFIVELKPGEGFTKEEFTAAAKSVTFCGLRNTARINLTSGVVSATGDAVNINPYDTGEDFRAIVVPQDSNSSGPLLSIVVSGVSFSLSQHITFQTKTKHKLTVQVDKTQTGIVFNIEGWETDPNDYSGIAK
ncbi:MAG: fimbrillin family protein [Bacteroidales bacterium]|nr:fimbrillin family protein [Bacteroidales bacterium]